MLSRAAKSSSLIPSRNALRVLRQLALAGSTVGGFCTVAAFTYDANRRVRIAEKIIENKRTLHSTAPNYDATSAAKRLKVMVEAAEAGEFMGIESLKARNRNVPDGPHEPGSETEKTIHNSKPKPLVSLEKHHARTKRSILGSQPNAQFNYKDKMDAPSLARNAEVLAREKKQAEIARESGRLPFDAEICRLLNEEREITAANLFLAHTRQTPVISWERRELACLIFTANCIKGNLFVARTLFNRIDKVSIVSNEMWATLMHLLAKEGHIDSVGVIYEKYRTNFVVPTHLLEVILRCLIESKRLDSAKFLFFQRFKDDRDCGLCGAYLDGLWRKTRSIELLSSQLGLILKRLESLDRKPTEKLFNPMVKAMVETGRGEEAEAMVKAMSAHYGCQPGCRTIGMIIYNRALNCEWDRVMDGMRAMHEHGYTDSKKDFAIVFDRVFLEYYPTHTGQQILDFVISCINDFDIQPDKVLHRHILEAIIEKGTEDMITTIMEMADEQKWNTGINDRFIESLVKSRKIAMTDNPVGIWRLKQAANHRQDHLSSSRRILGSSSDTWAVRGDKIAPIHVPAEETFPQTVSEMVASKNASLYVPLHKRMEHLINMGKHTDALAIYDQATRGGYIVRPVHLTLAVIAALLSCKKTGLANARRLITSEWEYWKNVPSLRYTKRYTSWTPIFFQRVMKVDPAAAGRGGLIKMAIFEYYNVCANTNGLVVKHFCAASSSRYLIGGGTPELAVDLLTAIYQSRWRLSHGFDQVLLKMLMRAFANLDNLKGFWWCIMTVLSRNESIKRDFIVEATSQLESLEKKLLSSASHDTAEEIAILQRTVKVLEAKSQGDSHWSAISVHPEWKKLRRSNPIKPTKKQSLLPTTDLEDLVMNFDEEWELDMLLKRKRFDTSEHAKWWAESNLAEVHSVPPEDPNYPWYEPETWDGYYVPEKYSPDYHLEFSPMGDHGHYQEYEDYQGPRDCV
ncbi:Pentatricopeptide repeat protein [Penicillium paradoxum]|uniref:Pentatricopeptide repeat protein n=1 Tax=Penicillium paradoxum TaxID=176176 RepID=UPI0025498B4D|nr:Pentatricopeptide repeat protein [Penicillium paradoxum]KAJ5794863.1 Pentatricopeptide repeat protein [Penicillium paradoxum]